jgi:ADP-ribosylglycohydrolase
MEMSDPNSWDQFIASVEPGSIMDRLIGSIYGHALGDAVGLQTEFKFKADNHEIKFPYDRAIRDFPKCDWTDDTDHLIIVMQSLIENKIELNQSDIARRLKSWVLSGFPELKDTMGMGLGGTMSMVIRHPKFLEEPEIAAGEIWNNSGKKLASNGSLMRTSIVGTLPITRDIYNIAASLSKIMHSDPRCVAACVFQSTAIHNLVYKQVNNVDDLMEKCTSISQLYVADDVPAVIFENVRHQPTPKSYLDPRFKSRAEEFKYWIDLAYTQDITALELDEQVRIGFVLKCLGCSVFALQMIGLSIRYKKPICFKKFITRIIVECGDADTNAAVAGATMGAHLGYSRLPRDWIEALPNRAWLNDIILQYLRVLQ